MKKVIYFIICCFWSINAFAKVLDMATFTLDNGLEVAVIENHKAPVVLQMIYYKTGSINDPKGKGGIAHLLEHLMFRGTKNVKDQEFNRLTDRYGAESNAYTTFNETGYHEFSDVSKLELMMALEADRMENLIISDEAFEAERDIVYEERMQRFESNPVSLFYETLQKMLWQDSPLSNPVSGSPDEIKGLSKQDAIDFYQKWYKPNNALLVLSGDIDFNEAKVLVKKYYGGLKKGDILKPEVLPCGRENVTTIDMRLDGVNEPRVVMETKLRAKEFDKKEVLALGLLAEYLAGDDTSYLYDKLVYEEPFLLGVSVDVSYDDNMGGSFAIYATPASHESDLKLLLERLEQALLEGVKALDQDKLEKIKSKILSDVIYMVEEPETSARFVGNLLREGYDVSEIINYDELIKSITLDDVFKAYDKVLKSPAKLNGYLGGKS